MSLATVDYPRGVVGRYAARFIRTQSEYLTIPAASVGAYHFGSSDYTIAGQAYFDATPAIEFGLFSRYTGTGNQRSWRIIRGTDASLQHTVSDNGTAVYGAATTKLQPGRWHFCAIYKQGTTIYVRANEDAASSAAAPATLFNSTSDLAVGALGSPASTGQFMDGRMYGWGVWLRALTSAELTWLNNNNRGRRYAELTDAIKVGLLSWYQLDEKSGTRYDSHGTYHLTDNNTVGYGDSPVGGGPRVPVGSTRAARFVRTSSEYLSRAAGDCANLTPGDTSFTTGVRVKLASKPASMVALSKVLSDTYSLYYQGGTSDSFQAWIFNSTYRIVAGSMSPVLGKWYTLVLRYDASADVVALFVDGVQVKTLSTTPGPANASGEFRIGLGTGATNWDGDLAEGFYSARALSDAEIADLHRGGHGTRYSELTDAQKVGLVSWWDLDEESGTRHDAHGDNDLTDNNTVGYSVGTRQMRARIGSYAERILDQSPVLVWPLDELSGTTIADASGNDRTATAINAPTQGAAGAVEGGTAYTFNGTSQYLEADDLGLPAACANTITVEWLMKIDDWAWSTRTSFGMSDGATTTTQFQPYLYGDTVSTGTPSRRLEMYATRGGAWGLVSPRSRPLRQGVWFHCAWVYDSALGGQLYINGTPQGTTPVGSGALFAATTALRVGRGHFQPYHKGSLDHFSITPRALSADEVRLNALAALSRTRRTFAAPADLTDADAVILADNPLAYYPLDEVSGTQARDATGKGNHATYGGGVTLGVAGPLQGQESSGFESATAGGGWLQLPPMAGRTVEMWVRVPATINPIPGYLLDLRNVVASNYAYFSSDTTGAVQTMTLKAVNGVPMNHSVANSTLGIVPFNTRSAWQHLVFESNVAWLTSSYGVVGGRQNNIESIVGARYSRVAVYDRVLTTEEILRHYRAGRSLSPRIAADGLGSEPGLVLWLRADRERLWASTERLTRVTLDGDAVGHFAGLSQSDPFNQSVAATRPLYRPEFVNGYDALEFNGAHSLTGSWGRAPRETKTVIVAVRPASDASNNVNIILGNSNANWYVSWVPLTRLLRTSHSNSANAQIVHSTNLSVYNADEWNIFTFIWNVEGTTVTVTMRVNGVQVYQSTGGVGVTTGVPPTTWRLMSFNGSSFFARGVFRELGVFNRILAPHRLAALERAMGREVGLTIA